MTTRKESLRILGIDPGFDRMGCAVLEKKSGREVLSYSTCILSKRASGHAERLYSVGAGVKKIIKKYKPDLIAVESLFFSKNQKTAIAVARAAGLVFYLAGEAGIPVVEYAPQEIKMALTGYGKAEKRQVATMICAILQTDFPKNTLDDEIDAIAVALTASARSRV